MLECERALEYAWAVYERPADRGFGRRALHRLTVTWPTTSVSSRVRFGIAIARVLLARLVESDQRLAACRHLNRRLERRDDLIERVHDTVLYDPVRRCGELEVLERVTVDDRQIRQLADFDRPEILV